MLKRYISLLKKDIKIAFRNQFFAIVIGVALLFVGLINFLIPGELSLKPSVYYFIGYEGRIKPALEQVLEEAGREHGNVHRKGSVEEIEAEMRKDYNSLGMVIGDLEGKPHIEFIMQGHENEKVINALVLSIKDNIRSRMHADKEIKTVFLNQDQDAKKIPFNHTWIPVFVVMESVLLGFFMIAVLIFLEKDERTLTAYMVSPGRIPEYLASKITLMAILGCISSLTLVFLTLGLRAEYLSLFVFVVLGSIAAAISGLILASFFNNVSQASVWIIAFSLILALPFMSYYFPSFAPLIVKAVPTYYLLFAAREILFFGGNRGVLYSALKGLALFDIAGYLAAVAVYRLRLTKSQEV
ncbi:ABC transporter permease [Thermosediminibacter litoriperuensis]|uniref:ABC-type Na+ efflux pump permease subunit n=1 Tax=Thermosediminibacter litoriperuensis TaxID=291989 RepID=A0A5S5ASM5_9FIRM|nr:ABC transporter permease [Thermosediminibacter litoriperuensis]TYP55447.1 ABC-type Na+ efflux pump permease subunit [Thermosediminibacter litoriperuensis]